MIPVLSARFGFFDDLFAVDSLRDFEGREWGGVRLDETTRDDFKRRYKTRGGKFVRPDALIVTPSSSAPWEIQALVDGKGNDARLTGFHLTFRDRGIRLDRVLEEIDAPTEEGYPRERFSDWNLTLVPNRGIALMVVHEDDDRVPFALLTTRSRLERIGNALERNPTPVRDIADRFDRLDRTVEIGNTLVNLTRKDLRPRFEDLTLSGVRLRLPREIQSSDIRYSGRGSGSVIVNISIGFRDGDRNNAVSAFAQLNGSNERGGVSAGGTGRYPLDRKESDAKRDVDQAIRTAFELAIVDLRRQVARKINGQKPSSPADYRAGAFVRLIDAATRE